MEHLRKIKKSQFNTYVGDTIQDRVKEVAQKIDIPISWIVETALVEWLEKNENGVVVEEPA